MEAATVPTRALVTASSLNVRTGPDTSYDKVGELPEGTEVHILERSGDWFRVSGSNGLKGWVHGNYLTARLDGVRIVVDPGHGGSYGGAYANGIVERDVNLTIALYLRDVLLARGAQVRMTRETWKENPPLYTSDPKDPASRTGLANSWPADMLLSVHNNSSANTSARGMMTIWGNAPQSQALAQAVLARTLYWTNMRQGFDHQKFGKGVYRDTEIRRHTLAITNRSQVPATIIEVAFVSNKDDAALLKNDAFLRAAAKGIADGAGAFVLNRVPEGPAGGGDGGTPGDQDPGDNPPDDGSPGEGSPGSDEPASGDRGGGGGTPGSPNNKVELFPDVAGTLADEVHRARQLGLVDGYGDGRFRPNDPVTRAAFAKMVVLAVEKATGQSLPRPDQSPFKDVSQRQALYEYVVKAAAAKYIRGYGDGTFRPNLAIPREQVAAILQRAAKLEGRPEPFVDVSGSSPFAPAIGAVVEAGLMKGEGGGIFGYGKPITRAQAAAVAVRLYEYLKGGN